MVRSPQSLSLILTLSASVAASIVDPCHGTALLDGSAGEIAIGSKANEWSPSAELVARTRAARADKLPYRRLRHTRRAASVPAVPASTTRPGIPSSTPDEVEFPELRTIEDFGDGSPEAPTDTLTRAILRPRPWLFVDRGPSGRAMFRLGVRDADRGATAVLRLFDVQGRRVATLWSGTLGDDLALEWNGRDESGRIVPRGVYFARAVFGSTVLRGRLVLAHR